MERSGERNRVPIRWAALMILAGSLLAAGPARASGSLTLTSAIGQPGGTVTVSVVTDAAFSAAGLNLTLGFDPVLGLAVADIQAGPLILPNPTFNAGSGTAKLVFAGSQLVNGPGTIASLTFHLPVGAATGAVFPIAVTGAIANDYTQAFTLASSPGSITVRTTVIPGDLNGNGKVDAADLNLIFRIFLGLLSPTPAQLAAADNRPKPGSNGRSYGDGQIGADDIGWLLRRFLGLETAP